MGDVIQFPTPELALGLKSKKQPMTTAPAVPAPAAPAPNPYVRPTRSRNCHACGARPRHGISRYCLDCTTAGLDSPIINCRHEGCTTAGKRQFVGQQWFWCPQHHPGKTT